MRFPLVLATTALTFFCWGAYGPVLHEGQAALGEAGRPSSLRAFICVGLAYFLIAVVVPVFVLYTKGEKGNWTAGGLVWSIAAGLVTAVGALGIILAFKFRGNPIYVMPLVFGCAPVVNTFVTMAMSRTMNAAGPVFYAGVLLAALGAAGVMAFKPTATNVAVTETADGRIMVELDDQAHKHKDRWGPMTYAELTSGKYPKAAGLYAKSRPLTARQWTLVFASIALTAVCWGAYGPLLHKGQMKMGGSRMRPFICVGLSYFLIAVILPFALMPAFDEPGRWTIPGTMWALGGGALGALGALGIIMAFNFGGKPIYVMPIVFGCAPLINTFITVVEEGTTSNLSPIFFVSLLLAIVGAVTVLVFAPKGHPPAPGGKPHEPAGKQPAAAH